MAIKHVFKISKQLLLNLASGKNNIDDTINLMPEYRDYSKCKTTCPFYEKRDLLDHCKNHCVFVLSTSSLKKPKDDYLTPSQIKQLLYYNATIFENNGVTRDLTHEEVSRYINCTRRTATANIHALVQAGYIVPMNGTSSYKVFVKGYKQYHNSVRGYLNISDKCFKALMSIKNINALRLALIGLVRLDDMRVSKELIKSFTYKALVNMLPSNISCNKQVIALMNKLKNIFVIKFNEDTVSISYNKDIDSVSYKEKLENNNKKALKKFLKRFAISTDKAQFKDLLQMSIQYGIKIVTSAFNYIKTDPEDLCPYVRTIIRKYFNALIIK